MRDRNRFNTDTILKNQLLTEGIVNVDIFKKTNKEKQNKLSMFLSKIALKATIGVASKSRVAKDIIASGGKAVKYKPYNDAVEILKAANRISDPEVPADFKIALKELNAMNLILEKDSNVINAFHKGIQNRDSLVSMLYVACVASFCQSAALLFSKYLYLKEKGGIGAKHDDQKLTSRSTFEELEKLNDLYKNGHFNKAFIYKDKNLEESATITIAAGMTAVIGLLFVIRLVIFKLYEMRVSLADQLRLSADILIENTVSLNDGKVKDRQLKASETFKKLADKIDIEDDLVSKSAETAIGKLDSKAVSEFNKIDDDTDIQGVSFGF
jgi:hypothetical protein